METGINVEIDNDEYHAMEGVSNSRLKDMRDPRVYCYKHLVGEYKPEHNACFDFGTCVHEIVLLGDASGIVIIPPSVLSKSGSKAGNAWKEFQADNSGKIMLKSSEYEAVMRCVDAVRANAKVAEYLNYPGGERERAYWSNDETLGLRLRCKTDLCVEVGKNTVDVFDLKTTAKPTGAADFVKSVANFGYHRQEYFYRRVLRMCGIEVRRFVFCAVSVDAPHTVDCFTLDSDFMRHAETEVENDLMNLAERTRSGDWSSRTAERLVELSPPNFMKYTGDYAV